MQHRYHNSKSVEPADRHDSAPTHSELVVTGQKDQERTAEIIDRVRKLSSQLENADYHGRAFKGIKPAHLRFKQQ